jgi:hypothetical protein
VVEQSFTALSLKQTFHRTTPVPGRDPPLSLPRPSSAHLTSPRLASPRRPSSNPTGRRERRDERRQGSESWRDPRRRARRKGKQSKAGSFGLCWAVAWLDRLSREGFTCMPLKKMMPTSVPPEKLLTPMCHRPKLFCPLRHSVLTPSISHR